MIFKLLWCVINSSKLIKRGFCTSVKNYEKNTAVNSKNVVIEKWEEKLKIWMRKYEDLFGITKLTEMHERVLEAQTNVQQIQEKRRNAQENIFAVEKKLQEMQEVLHKTSMGDSHYIPLITQVHELILEQKRLREVFSLYDQTEREQQVALALAINTSQDHERTYRDKNKYLSLITGAVGGVVGLLGSSINNWRRKKDIKGFAQSVSSDVDNLVKDVTLEITTFARDLSNQLSNLRKTIESTTLLSETGNSPTEVFGLLSSLKVQHNLLNENIKRLSLLNDKLLNGSENDNPYGGFLIEKTLNQIEDNIDLKLKYHSFVNVGLFSMLTLVCVFMFYVTKIQ